MDKWMPIETAPKDGTEVQLWGDEDWIPKARWLHVHGGWYVEYWDADWRSYSDSAVYNPTHWMPLPAPPQESENEQR